MLLVKLQLKVALSCKLGGVVSQKSALFPTFLHCHRRLVQTPGGGDGGKLDFY